MRAIFLFPLLVIISCNTTVVSEANSISKVDTSFFVGTKYFVWENPHQKDPYYGKNRLINVQVWYPIDTSDADRLIAPYYYQIDKAFPHLDSWDESDLQLVSSIQTNALVNKEISQKEDSYPLLLFSPSLGGNLSMYTYYAEQLAKSGYVVAGINHLYESEYVINPAGNTYLNNISFHDSLENLEIPEQITGDGFREAKSLRQEVLADDLLFCLDQLAEINSMEFNGRIDFNRIGAWGHSIGGAAAIYASLKDERIDAVINLDGTPPSDALQQGLNVPFMFIEDLTDYKNHQGYAIQFKRRSDFCKKIAADAFRILIGGIDHQSFFDIHYQTAKGETARVKELKVLESINGYIKGFFDHYLFGNEMQINPIMSDSLEIIVF